jgi:soluble lytic murein transglycosylase-like protein
VRHLSATLFCIIALGGGGAARADVLEISDDGTVLVRSGGTDVQWVDPTAVDADGGDAIADLPTAAITSLAVPEMPREWRDAVLASAARYRISPDLLATLIWQESRWQPAAISSKGATGLTQLMPQTARTLSVDPRDPVANIEGGARYLRQLLDLFDGDMERALAAYNAGPARVQQAGGIPRIAETRSYVAAIIDRLTPPALTPTQPAQGD